MMEIVAKSVAARMAESTDSADGEAVMKAMMAAHGHRLFALYEQTRDLPTLPQALARVDPAFASPALPERHRG